VGALQTAPPSQVTSISAAGFVVSKLFGASVCAFCGVVFHSDGA